MIKSIFTNSFIVSALTILQFFVMFLSQVMLARIIEPEVFGVFAIITVISMFFHTASNLNSDRYIIREQADIEKKMDVTFTMELLWSLTIFIIAIFILPFVLLCIDRQDILVYCQVYVIACLFNPFSKLKSLMEKDASFVKSSVPMVFSSIISSIIAIVMANHDAGLWALVVWRSLSYIIEGIIIYAISEYKPRLKFDIDIIKKSQRFSYPLTIGLIVSFVYGNVDYIIIDRLIDVNSVGFYWLAYQTSHYFLAIRGSINRVVYPALSRIERSNDKEILFDNVNFITCFVYIIPVIVTFFLGDEFIVYVYGQEWSESVILFKIFMLVVLFKAVASSAGPLLHINGNTRNDLEVALINLILLPIAIYIMVKYYGVVGAAVGVGVISTFSGFYVYQRYVKAITGKGYFRYFGKLIFICSVVFFWDFLFHSESVLIGCIYTIVAVTCTVLLYFKRLKYLLSGVKRGV
ncbi:hypothetical protein VFDL14_15685 [Vibrio fortis]|uniref:Oligosaccharide flippase family protein n=1 Tax=Vibrio fortis TaxID=212667 RepID=A0A066UX01_9VIBR|nr:oligosaccharide flippase family protein [Vibrio fortis]KDN28689.1 hypothetical protein VFDL14_15685 [Vibrio fortis]